MSVYSRLLDEVIPDSDAITKIVEQHLDPYGKYKTIPLLPGQPQQFAQDLDDGARIVLHLVYPAHMQVASLQVPRKDRSGLLLLAIIKRNTEAPFRYELVDMTFGNYKDKIDTSKLETYIRLLLGAARTHFTHEPDEQVPIFSRVQPEEWKRFVRMEGGRTRCKSNKCQSEKPKSIQKERPGAKTKSLRK